MQKIKKRGIRFVMAMILTLSLTACGKDSDLVDVTDLQQYKTDYVGDSPNVVNIVCHQEYPKGYSYDHIEIHSKTKPYGLKVFLKIEPKTEKIEVQLQVNADMTFELIANLGTLDFVNVDTEEIIASYEKSK
ncbi:MAG: DUF4825 domain-containing protein [Lachnospiraceae bacterium]|nr:DUF4825 domain-containing protein [Lachnospiraceae bacterium]